MKKIEEQETVRTPSGRVDIEVFEDYRGIVLRMGETHMFEPGKADLRPSIWSFLNEVMEQAALNGAQIKVEAHTDSTPINSRAYPSNDHLSAARAVAVIRHFQKTRGDVPGHRFEAVPAGETRPMTSNATAAGRKKNRRVELIFHRAPKVYEYKTNEAIPPGSR